MNLNMSTNAWGYTGSYDNMYNNKFTYDGNGNILTQQRRDSAGKMINALTYNRYSVDGRTVQNRLYSVNDTVASGRFSDDIDDEGTFDNSSLANVEANNNYRYDEIGSLNHNTQKEIDTIKYSVYGKVKEVIRTSGSSKRNLKFDYDASNNRIAKHVYTSAGVWQFSDYYTRDAQGNVMSIYRKTNSDFAQTEKDIYGSSRIGIDKTTTASDLDGKEQKLQTFSNITNDEFSQEKLDANKVRDQTVDKIFAAISGGLPSTSEMHNYDPKRNPNLTIAETQTAKATLSQFIYVDPKDPSQINFIVPGKDENESIIFGIAKDVVKEATPDALKESGLATAGFGGELLKSASFKISANALNFRPDKAGRSVSAIANTRALGNLSKFVGSALEFTGKVLNVAGGLSIAFDILNAGSPKQTSLEDVQAATVKAYINLFKDATNKQVQSPSKNTSDQGSGGATVTPSPGTNTH